LTKDIVGPLRVPFLLLPPVCCLLGIGTAVDAAGSVNPLDVFLVIIGAILSHICVNTFNEYDDFKSGLDARTKRTPFSGGSGVLPGKPEMARSVLYMALGSLLLTVLIGIYFLIVRGIGLLPLGLLGLFLTVAYTPWLTRSPLLCLIAPGVGFGPVMVMGTHFALTGHYSLSAFFASLVPFFLVSNLLLLNQFPDVEADRSVGRKHVLIVLGRQRSSLIYSLFLALAYLAIVVGVCWGQMPKSSLLGLATILLAIPASVGSIRHAENTPNLVPYLGLNVIINLVTPVLVAVGLFIGW
jgi:1,4-dihydroxy-2-naphthoate polyprenyltransferase